MREHYAPDAPGESTPSPVPYKDRSVGLNVFGVLTILLGCLAGLFVLLIFAQVALVGTTNSQINATALLPSLAMYGVLAVALVWLGIGSIMARRWARALLVVFSWSWLIVGVLTVMALAVFMPRVLANLSSSGTANQHTLDTTAGARQLILAFIFVFYGVVLVIMPAIWTFFYSSRHVKATCQARDPVTRWTDACPLPVLGICAWLAISAPAMLLMPLAANGVMPFFGTFVSGVPGMVFCFGMAALWLYAAWSLYKLERRGWWVLVIALGAVLVSGLITFARHDVMEMYRLMNYPEAQIEQIQKLGIFNGNYLAWMMLMFMVPLIGYLLYIKKFFHGPAGAA